MDDKYVASGKLADSIENEATVTLEYHVAQLAKGLDLIPNIHKRNLSKVSLLTDSIDTSLDSGDVSIAISAVETTFYEMEQDLEQIGDERKNLVGLRDNIKGLLKKRVEYHYCNFAKTYSKSDASEKPFLEIAFQYQTIIEALYGIINDYNEAITELKNTQETEKAAFRSEKDKLISSINQNHSQFSDTKGI
ncbi:MAG: hypothetical protein QF436_02480 [Candidatus Woesearchaeota archaeon]|jgi:hypothetical protein|nr:hypothetical protein [Candidatus Woesearchaeota archaeon]MDP7622957.1 hypothetical protein [Candidatus Woesearchaeota archaeon]HJN57104.1 hypothetical protein [Candidatus Woesearchaeota archaeon]|tara:strand:+ start:2963 stop:3538 length:576 start_codon:yes stop_codon:yes gene_type:complete